jgi:hypothetical protein
MTTRKHTLEVLSIIVAIVSVIIAGLSMIKSCNSEKNLNEFSHKLASIENRPMVRFFNPKLLGFKIICDSVPLNPAQIYNDSILDIKCNIEIKVRLHLKNIGNSNAKLIGCLLTDTISQYPLLKTYIKDIENRLEKSDDNILFQFPYQDISVYDTTYIDFKHTIQYIENNKFIIHFLLFYQNDLEQQYDTYYWLNFDLNELITKNYHDRTKNNVIVSFKRSDLMNFVKISGENNYSINYSEKEKQKNLDRLEKLR